MLTLLEEVVLLTIDPKTGGLRGGSEFSVRYGLVGAVLFDLALARRIDTDVETIAVIDPTPTGHAIQDDLLARLANGRAPLNIRQCVEDLFLQSQDLERHVLDQLQSRGIIRHQTDKLLWVIDRHRFPLVDGTPQRLVTVRVAQAILEDTIPETRDIMLVSLAAACGLLGVVLAEGQIEARADWIRTLSGIESISRNVGTAIASLVADLAGGLGMGAGIMA